jgi:hypothetical protein
MSTIIPEQAAVTAVLDDRRQLVLEQGGQRIVVAPEFAVSLARAVIEAIGYRGVLIASGVGGGYADLNDGDLPEDFGDHDTGPPLDVEHARIIAQMRARPDIDWGAVFRDMPDWARDGRYERKPEPERPGGNDLVDEMQGRGR